MEESNRPLGLDLNRIRVELEDLLPLTIDQLRTFIAICHERSVRRGGISIGRDQSSVEKQLKKIEDHFRNMSDSGLFLRPSHRGADVHLTEAGERVLGLATSIFDAMLETCSELRKLRHERPIRFAITTFMIAVLNEVQPLAVQEFAKKGIRLSRELIHVRSNNIQTVIAQDRSIDFALGGIIAEEGEAAAVDDDLVFHEWRREDLVLLSNAGIENDVVGMDQIARGEIPMILPRQGVINELVSRQFGGPPFGSLNVVEWCDDVHFALDLLHLQIYEAAMIATDYIASRAMERPGSGHLKLHRLSGCDYRLRVGIFTRRGEIEVYNRNHPIRMFLDTFIKMSKERK
jgi:DNA-binding transcriptional LysR family regulator